MRVAVMLQRFSTTVTGTEAMDQQSIIVRLGADRDGALELVTHDVVEQTSTVQEFAEQIAAAALEEVPADHLRLVGDVSSFAPVD